MMSAQTAQVLLGTLAALVYAAAVAALGSMALMAFAGAQGRAAVRDRIGMLGVLWLGFVVGQGLLGLVWFVLALAGRFSAWGIVLVCALGWLVIGISGRPVYKATAPILQELWNRLVSLRKSRSWYFWVVLGIVIVTGLRGLIALLPTDVADALKAYLVTAEVIATSGSLQFQPFVHPFYALLPLQVELHWAALFAITNEAGVTVWDYVCALSSLTGVPVLAYALVESRKVAVMAALMLLSTPAFYSVMGGGKIDNAAAQYGIAACLCVTLWPALRHRAIVLTGLFAGWAMASRYTDVIVIPALIVLGVSVVQRGLKTTSPTQIMAGEARRLWLSIAAAGGLSAGLAVVPMLIKNWVLVGCPLAPQFGCQDTFWANIYSGLTASMENISLADLLFYPLVWTFAGRENMLGNVSPLFVGLFLLVLLYRRSTIVQRASIGGLTGLVALGAWLLVEPRILHTRWLLVPLALIGVPLGAALVAFDQDRLQGRLVHWLARTAVLSLLAFVVFESRAAAYGIRYLAAVDSRTARYEASSGYDVASWLNAHVRQGERVALAGYGGFPYFVSPGILGNSESRGELQWLWEHNGRPTNRSSGASSTLGASTFDLKVNFLASSWTPEVWRFHARSGFAYIVVSADRLDPALASWPDGANAGPRVVFVGRQDAVVRMVPRGGAFLAPVLEKR